MSKHKRNHLRLGILVLAGISFFIVSVYLLGKKQNLFSDVITITAHFSDVKGLQIGNNVQFSGINVGTVSEVKIINDSTVVVEMSIKEELAQFIRQDSKVEISSDGLMGSKMIVVNPGTSHTDPILEGDKLQIEVSITTDELLLETKNIIQNSKLITENLIEASEKINVGNGDIAALLNKDNLTTNIGAITNQMLTITEQLEEITKKINNGNGDVATLLNDNNITTQTSTILTRFDSVAMTSQQATANLLQISEDLKNGNGVINKLVYDTITAQQLDSILVKLSTGLDETRKAVETVQSSWMLNVFSKKEDKKK